MLQVLYSLKNLMNAHRRNSETFVFYLHYRVTFLILIGFSILITTNQIVGEKIHCLAGENTKINSALLESYCWVSSTYSVSTAYLNETGFKAPYPGISLSGKKSELIYKNYYQYIYLCLFVQALFFYLPHLVWKSVEWKRMDRLYHLIINYDKKQKKDTESHSSTPFEEAAAYIEERWGTHKEYIILYVACEVLSFMNLIVQIYIVDIFLHGEFFGLGLFYASHQNSHWMQDPIHLFPLVSSCYFKKYGAGGNIDVIDAICVLPLNALNVKMYLFIWFWFTLLLFLAVFNLSNMLLNICIPSYRMLPFSLSRVIFKSAPGRTAYTDLLENGNFGDWFVLSSIKSNMDPIDFNHLSEKILEKLSDIAVEQKE